MVGPWSIISSRIKCASRLSTFFKYVERDALLFAALAWKNDKQRSSSYSTFIKACTHTPIFGESVIESTDSTADPPVGMQCAKLGFFFTGPGDSGP